MKKILLLIFTLAAPSLYAQMYQGSVTEATGTKSHLLNTTCFAYIHTSDSKIADVSLNFGNESDLVHERYAMSKKDLAIGDRFLGYDYGYREEYSTNEKSSDGYRIHTKHLKESILNISSDKENAKYIYWYTEDEGQFFNQSPFFKVECKMSKTN